jgi:hypothetical protein
MREKHGIKTGGHIKRKLQAHEHRCGHLRACPTFPELAANVLNACCAIHRYVLGDDTEQIALASAQLLKEFVGGYQFLSLLFALLEQSLVLRGTFEGTVAISTMQITFPAVLDVLSVYW